MRCEIYGKVLARSVFHAQHGDIYSLEIEEPGIYPSVYKISSQDASLFGQPDGPFAVGRYIKATCFGKGRAQEVTGKNGKGKFRAFRVTFTVTRLTSAEPVEPSAPEASDEIPY